MTISITASQCTYSGDGSTTAFDVKSGADGIFFEANSELVVTLEQDGIVTSQSIGTHYTVTGAGTASGVVTFLTAPASGKTVRIKRVTPRTQLLALASGGPFNPSAIMGALDKGIRITQELTRDVVPLPAASAGQYLGWNDAGTALENKDGADYSLTIGSVTTGSPGSSASATITGTPTDAVLNLTIPRGDTGAAGVGSGDLLAANNLSDLANRKVGRDNLSIRGADVASASTIDLDAATGYSVEVTGTTAITAITLAAGRERWVRFTGALTLTHGSSLVLPNSANITTEAGDWARFVGYAGGVVRCTNYMRASYATQFSDIKQAATASATGVVELATGAEAATGTDTTRAVTPAGLFPGEVDVASASTTDLGAAVSVNVRITGTTTINGFGTANAGIYRRGRFADALQLTHNATSLILPGGANITTAANDRFTALSLGSGNWLVTSYVKADGQPIVGASLSAASQAQQESASSTSVYVSPGRQQFHPSAAKAWVRFNSAGTIAASYNVTSITDHNPGDWTVNIDVDFSSANYVGVVMAGQENSVRMLSVSCSGSPAAGTFRIKSARYDTAGGDYILADPVDPNAMFAVFYGDQ